jgi:type IV pilus assembly protein PilE
MSGKRRSSGFSLIELMFVVTIIGILAAIAVPNYQEYLRKSRRADVTGTLTSFAAAMERYYTQHNSYLGSAQGGAPGAPIASLFASQAPVDGNNKTYNLTIQSLSASNFTLRATPISVQQGDGYLELLSSGARQWDRNNNGTIEAAERCWEGRCN